MTFNHTWNLYKDHLLNFIKLKIDDNEIAEDILQEVGIKLFESFRRKIEIKNYKNWLFQVTRNTITDFYRKQKRETTFINNQFKNTSEPNICVCDLAGFVIQNYVPEKYSVALYLSDIEQKSQQEISSLLHLSLTATKSRIHRGRKKLKELVSECVDITYNTNGQISEFQLKKNCELPKELITEMERINLTL